MTGKLLKAAAALLAALALGGCVNANFKLFTDATDPLKEQALAGSGPGKVLMIPIHGMISASPDGNFMKSNPSVVQDVVSQLDMASKDKEVRAVLLVVNSPGGTVTASDMIYNELMKFKAKTGAKVVVSMLDVAASGGYYVSLPADCIYAHPTTVTGSVGVIFIRPQVYGLLDKIGVSVHADTSGKYKDMGSPFRKPLPDEDKLFSKLVEDLAKKFTDKVRQRRALSDKAMEEIATAKVFSADDALAVGLVDKVGYLEDAIGKAKELGGLRHDAKLVVYRRDSFPNDNIYNMSTSAGPEKPLVDTGAIGRLATMQAGFYYLWPAATP